MKFRMDDYAPISTPMVIGCKMSKDDESPKENQMSYMSIIGSLLYVTESRLDIMQELG